MLTAEQRRSFAETGLLRLPQAAPEALVADMRERLWAGFDRAGIPHHGTPELSADEQRPAVKRLRHTGGLDRIYTEANPTASASVADAPTLLDDAVAERSRALLLLTLPSSAPPPWRVPHNVWHTDCPRLPGGGVPGIILLAFVDAVRPTGGGTVVLAGSHRLLATTERGLSSRQLKKSLKRHAFFRTLFSKAHAESADRDRELQEPHCVDGVHVEVVELTGEPGDAVLLDGRILHTLAPNCRMEPRLMVRGFYAGAQLRAAYSSRGMVPE